MINNKKMSEAEQKRKQKELEEELKKCKIGKTSDFPPIVWKEESIPEARVRDRLQHIHCFNTMYSLTDPKTKTMIFEIAVNGNPDHLTRVFTFEDVCKEFGWKSFTIAKDFQTIKPKW